MDNFDASSEYAVQLLTYPPKTIVDFVLGTLDSAVTECLDAMEKSLLLSSLIQDIPKEDIEKGLTQLKSRFVKKMEPISGKLERFILDIVLSIPDHVLLPEDSCQRTKHSSKVQKKLLKDIETIKQEIQAEKYKNLLYKGKLKEAAETLENLKALSTDIESTSVCVFNDCKVQDACENSEFIKNNVNILSEKMACLHEILPQSKPTVHDLCLNEDNDNFLR